MNYAALVLQELQEICADVQILSATSLCFRGELREDIQDEDKLAPHGELGQALKTSALDVSTLDVLTLNESNSNESTVNAADQIAPELKNSSPAKYAALRENLCSMLYEKSYVRHFPLASDASEHAVATGELTPQFHQANQNKDGWDAGWRIYQLAPEGRLFVQKGERSRIVLAGEYTTYKWPGVPPAINDMVSVRLFSGSTDVQPSFFFAFGRTLSDQFDENLLVRFYFNITPEGAPQLMSLLTTALNRYLIPFKFKALVDASAYTRADSAVLYVAKRYYHIVASLMLELSVALKDLMRDGTPMFTKPLCRNIGLAEEPSDGKSFGWHRCGLVSNALVDAWAAGSQEVESRMQAIREEFSKNGIAMNAVYLNPNSVDIFEQTIFSHEIT